MDAPPPHEDPRPFIAVAEWLLGRGLSAPEILARDLEHGLLLLGDFGDARLRETLDEDPARETRTVCARDRRAGPSSRPPADARPASRTGSTSGSRSSKLFTDWYCPAVGAGGRCRRPISEPGGRCSSRSPPTGSGRSPCCATIMPRTSCWSMAARASRTSACSISRTRWPATRPTTWPRCWRMRAAMSPRRSSAR